MSDEKSARETWQSQDGGTPPPLEEVRKSADKFYRIVRRRNRIEYVACAVAVAVFGYYLFTMEHILHKIGSGLIIVAAIYAPWQLHRRASAVSPAIDGTVPIYVFMRAQFARQRDALKSIFVWYILPFLPGIALMIAGNGADPEIEAAGPPIWARWLALFGTVAIFVGIWWLNQLAARGLQKRIDEIDALMGDGG